jgi:hypothetical protein
MRVKIFQAFGRGEIEGLERAVNEWLRDSSIRVHHTNSAAASISEAGGSTETSQTLIVSVWYETSK